MSKADAELLARYARDAHQIVEFGVGGSTQILRYYSTGTVTAFETNQEWVDRVRDCLHELGMERYSVDFKLYSPIPEAQVKECDLIFVDGADEYRLGFAIDYWPKLKIGGHLLFHDSRRDKDVATVSAFVQNLADVAKFYRSASPDVDRILVHEDNSNIVSIRRGPQRHYCEWNLEEKRPKWKCGYEPVNLEKWRQEIAEWKSNGSG